MSAEGRLLSVLRGHMRRSIKNTQPELGTVIQASPLVIQLDYDTNIQLHFSDGDFIVNDQLILEVGDQVALSELMGGHQYLVLCRVGGTVGTARIGRGDKAVARVGDTITGSFSGIGSDPQGGTVTVSGGITGIIASGSAKVKVE